MTLNLAVNLEESAKADPRKTALVLGEHEVSYAELRGAAKKFPNGLVSLGVQTGDKVALMAPNVPQWVVAYYGILYAGASAVPMNATYDAQGSPGSVGCGMDAYEHAVAYAQKREKFGRPIAKFQLVQDLLAQMLGNVTASQCMTLRLSQMQDKGVMKDEHASLAKAF